MRTESIAAKKFRPLFHSSKRVEFPAAHPQVVIEDLRRGCLSSLDRYLATHKGIPDRRVALELRKLLSGSRHRSDYRLLVIDHPDQPPSKGGRPQIRGPSPTEKDREIVERYHEVHQKEGKGYLARQVVADEFGISLSQVTRAIKKVRDAQIQEDLIQEERLDRERQLANVRTSREKARTAVRASRPPS